MCALKYLVWKPPLLDLLNVASARALIHAQFSKLGRGLDKWKGALSWFEEGY